MKKRSRLLLYFFLLATAFSSYGARPLSFDEAKLRSGLLIIRTTDYNGSDSGYIIVCNGVLDNKRVVKSNLHCTYGDHEFTGQDQILKKLSDDYVEDAIFVIGKERVKIPDYDDEYEDLLSLTRNVVEVHSGDIRKLRNGRVTINDDVAEFRLKKNIIFNGRYLDKVAVKSPSQGKLLLFGYVEENGYMIRVEEKLKVRTSSFGGYAYKMTYKNTTKTSGAPLYYQRGNQLYLSGLHNGSGLDNPYDKHAVKLGEGG